MEMEGKRSEMKEKRRGWREIGRGERTPFLDLVPILSLEGQRTRVEEESMTLWKKSAAVSLSFLPAVHHRGGWGSGQYFSNNYREHACSNTIS